uniref:Uncharacterized protein n=1 Tax=Panagrolaimus superbus TaxID=310955 RepID=A0A914YTI3_9BILA
MQETSTNDIIIYDGKVQKTPQELLNCPHQIITYKRPKELWLRNICEEFELPFSKTIFASDEPVDDIYYWCPDEVIKTESNGHCGFMSFSTILTGSPDHHGKIRTMIANHIIRSFDMVGGLIIFLFDKNPWGKNALEYANEDLEVDPNIPTHHWMRSLHLAAAADLFQCNVLVKRSDAHGWNCYNTMTYVHGIEKMEYISTLPSILIDNHSGNHFEPIITLKRIL